MPASKLVRHVYQDMLSHFGEPDGSVLFDDPPPPPGSGWPERIDVFFWNPTEDLDVYSFCTVGMCDRPQKGSDIRTELHFAIRTGADAVDVKKVAAFLANIALYPFMNDTSLDWSQLVNNPGQIPYFPRCPSVMFYPAFVENGWDSTKFQDTTVKYLNVVPLSAPECEFRRKNGPFSIYDYVMEHEIDLFQDRPS